MRHPTEGVLRRLLDEPAGVSDADRAHVQTCAACLTDLDAVRQDAELVSSSLGTAPPAVDVDAAWRRLSATAPAQQPAARASTRRSVSLLRRPSVAALAVAVALGGAGTAAANDWLPIFRTQQVQAVSITPGDLVALPDLSAYGELSFDSEPELREVASAAAARAETGLDVPVVQDLPRGVTGEPVHTIGGKVSATFTFSAERAARAAAEAGEDLPPIPPGLDGSSVRLDAGPGVAQVWTSASGAPALVVGRAVTPTAFSSSGVRFEAVRDYLLSLPGLSDEIADQLRAFSAAGSTLPLPLLADEVTTSVVEVQGMPGTLVVSRDRSLAGVVWVQDGLVTFVLGSLDDSEVLDVARGLG
jgi:hypothetical protein